MHTFAERTHARAAGSASSSPARRPPETARAIPAARRASSPPRHDFGRIRVSAGTPLLIQPKLKVNAPGDGLEREADRVAEQVTRDGAAEIGGGVSVGVAAAGAAARAVDEGFAERLERGRGAGAPLPAPVRAYFEPRFGHDFGAVRVHADGEAARLTDALGARAFTHGGGVYFGAGQLDAASAGGRRLIAHELTHVVQQRAGAGLIQMAPPETAVADAPAPVLTPEEQLKEQLEKLKAELKTTYGFADVVDGDATWTLAELREVEAALKLLPEENRAALAGVVLRRVATLGGTTAGKFTSSQSVSSTTVVDEAAIELADLTFASPGPDSHMVIVHEVGHALASLPGRIATRASHQAHAKANELIDISNADIDAANAAFDISDALYDPLKAALDELNAANKTDDEARKTAAKAAFDTLKADYDVKRAETDRLRAISEKSTANTKAAQAEAAKKDAAAKSKMISAAALAAIKTAVRTAEAAHTRAVAAADAKVAAFVKVPDDDAKDPAKQSEEYRAAVVAAGAAVKVFADSTADQALSEDDVETAIEAANAVLGAREPARQALAAAHADNPAVAAFAPVEMAQDAWFKAARAHSLAHQRSARVQKFVEFVEAGRIAPITAYAEESWPHKPEEFYAETYAMFLVKPGDLKAASKPLFDWFAAGKHL